MGEEQERRGTATTKENIMVAVVPLFPLCPSSLLIILSQNMNDSDERFIFWATMRSEEDDRRRREKE